MPLQYLLHVTSRPKPDSGVNNELWEKWYITEHVGCWHGRLADFPNPLVIDPD